MAGGNGYPRLIEVHDDIFKSLARDSEGAGNGRAIPFPIG